MQRYLIFIALVAMAVIAYGSLTRVGLPYALYFKLAPWLGHPKMHTYGLIEHLLVFAIFGALLGVAFPDRFILVCSLVVIFATLLEYFQTLTPDRHGTILDACEKVTGGLLGVCIAYAAIWWRRSTSGDHDKPLM